MSYLLVLMRDFGSLIRTGAWLKFAIVHPAVGDRYTNTWLNARTYKRDFPKEAATLNPNPTHLLHNILATITISIVANPILP